MTIARQKFTVELSDGTTHDIAVGNPSLVAWDRARSSMNWPSIADAPFLWMTWVCWHHMKSTKIIPSDTKYETFESELCMAIEDPDTAEKVAVEADGGKWEPDAVDPTAKTPESDSASP